jgi:hypothetical protein
MRVDLAVAGINHQPFMVRLINQDLQQGLPQSFIPPAAKAPVGILPISIVQRQVSPGSASTQYPENGVDKSAVIAGDTAPVALLSRQVRLK